MAIPWDLANGKCLHLYFFCPHSQIQNFFIHNFYKPNKITSYEKTFLLLVAFVATVVGASAQGQTAPHQRGVYVVRAGQQVRKVVSK